MTGGKKKKIQGKVQLFSTTRGAKGTRSDKLPNGSYGSIPPGSAKDKGYEQPCGGPGPKSLQSQTYGLDHQGAKDPGSEQLLGGQDKKNSLAPIYGLYHKGC